MYWKKIIGNYFFNSNRASSRGDVDCNLSAQVQVYIGDVKYAFFKIVGPKGPRVGWGGPRPHLRPEIYPKGPIGTHPEMLLSTRRVTNAPNMRTRSQKNFWTLWRNADLWRYGESVYRRLDLHREWGRLALDETLEFQNELLERIQHWKNLTHLCMFFFFKLNLKKYLINVFIHMLRMYHIFSCYLIFNYFFIN